MKKLTILLTLLAAIALVLAACGTPQPSAETTTTTQHTTTAEAAPVHQVRLHIPPTGDEIYSTYIYAEYDGTPEDVVRLLVQHGVLPDGTYLLGVTLHDDRTATLDMNEGFLQGQSQEEALRQVDGLGFTFAEFLGGLVGINFTAAGQPID
ncbi:MAG: GerMN domain-containing protein [Oscillospiraceae bacterium]|nr:GerMN domain-containing protein [Oscillospiraceae bacterium]